MGHLLDFHFLFKLVVNLRNKKHFFSKLYGDISSIIHSEIDMFVLVLVVATVLVSRVT